MRQAAKDLCTRLRVFMASPVVSLTSTPCSLLSRVAMLSQDMESVQLNASLLYRQLLQ